MHAALQTRTAARGRFVAFLLRRVGDELRVALWAYDGVAVIWLLPITNNGRARAPNATEHSGFFR